MYKSLKDLEKNIDKTKLTVMSFISCYHGASAIEKYYTKRDPKTFDKDDIGRMIKKHLEHAEASVEDLYEMGFIKLFGDFESFMYEFLVELYSKYPKSIGEEKKIDAKKIFEADNIEDLRRHVVDDLAVSDSYEIKTWKSILENRFNIVIFPDNKSEELFLVLNEIRNAILHSNGNANVKTIQKLSYLNANFVKRGEAISFKKEELFKWTFGAIKVILEKISGSSLKLKLNHQ